MCLLVQSTFLCCLKVIFCLYVGTNSIMHIGSKFVFYSVGRPLSHQISVRSSWYPVVMDRIENTNVIKSYGKSWDVTWNNRAVEQNYYFAWTHILVKWSHYETYKYIFWRLLFKSSAKSGKMPNIFARSKIQRSSVFPVCMVIQQFGIWSYCIKCNQISLTLLT